MLIQHTNLAGTVLADRVDVPGSALLVVLMSLDFLIVSLLRA